MGKTVEHAVLWNWEKKRNYYFVFESTAFVFSFFVFQVSILLVPLERLLDSRDEIWEGGYWNGIADCERARNKNSCRRLIPYSSTWLSFKYNIKRRKKNLSIICLPAGCFENNDVHDTVAAEMVSRCQSGNAGADDHHVGRLLLLLLHYVWSAEIPFVFRLIWRRGNDPMTGEKGRRALANDWSLGLTATEEEENVWLSRTAATDQMKSIISRQGREDLLF